MGSTETYADRKQVRHAVWLLQRVVGLGGPDMATSRADARIALCIASGIPLEDIDASLGYNRSETSYHDIRGQHVARLREDADNPWYIRDAEAAYASWKRMRPDLTEGDDWFAMAQTTGDE